jgi:hypothetical protein
MRIVIVDLKDTHAAALTDDGCIIKVKNRNYVIGQVIDLKKSFTKNPVKMVSAAVSAAAVVLLFSVTAWAYLTPYTYVSLDVNPSIEYEVNRFDRVLSVQAVNGDGAEILKDLELNNKTIDEAVKDTVDQIAQAGYFEGDAPGGVIISTSCKDSLSAENLANQLQSCAQETVKDSGTPVQVEAISVGLERVMEARTLGTTPGKLNLVQKLQAAVNDPSSINVQDWLNRPVKEIMKAIKSGKQVAKSAGNGSADSVSSAVNESGSESSATEVSSAPEEKTQSQAVSTPNKNQSKPKSGSTAAKITTKSSTSSITDSSSKVSKAPAKSAKDATASKAASDSKTSSTVSEASKGNGKSEAASKENSASKNGEATDSSNESSKSKDTGNSDSKDNGNGNKSTGKSGKSK